ncbi:MAG TPA: cytochrome c [Steroidobacter sp.]|nr:cytochrome c [Steroidobacter sp.]
MPLHPYKPKHKLLLMAAGAAMLVLLGVLAGFAILLSGTVNTEATRQHFKITHWLLEMGLRFSVRRSASDVEPPALDSPAMIAQGVACFRAYCVQCHGSPTAATEALAQGLLPTPASLVESGREWPAEQLYYVIKKGVRMTGMPAWEYRISDEGLWSTVAFLKRLPRLGRAEYAALEDEVSPSACPPNNAAPAGDSVEAAEVALRQYSCHSCHQIQGVVGPKTHVGPPLVHWSRRKYIAGVLPNTPDNLVRWILDPHTFSPATLMPDLNVAESHAKLMANYLFSLE